MYGPPDFIRLYKPNHINQFSMCNLSTLCFVRFLFFRSVTVAGKKGKMIERRILKDFQIGIVETIINEAVQSATKGGDVFTQIAKAMNKRSASKKYVFGPIFTYFSSNRTHFFSTLF